jgi:PKHD-type hydroxylase
MTMDLPFFSNPRHRADVEACALCQDAPTVAGLYAANGLETNDHLQQPFVYERVFTAEQCGRIRELGSREPIWEGRSSSEDDDYRVCMTSWLEETSATAFVYARLREVVRSVNGLYGLELAGFGEPLHYICYEPGGRFGWHTDLGPGLMSTRKISISVQLSDPADYEGGDLEFCPHGEVERFRGLGNAIAFPSYIAHSVTPVTSGHRHALVAWIHGTRFR